MLAETLLRIVNGRALGAWKKDSQYQSLEIQDDHT